MGITFIQVMPENPKDIKLIREAVRDHFLSIRGGGVTSLLERFRGKPAEGKAENKPEK